MSLRASLPPGLKRGARVEITVDGSPAEAYLGESVAAALMAADGAAATRVTVRGAPRGVFCGMGACFECLVVVDGVPNTRSCMTWVRDGMRVERQNGLGPAPAA